ncbi:MAG: hypothetical protein KDI15_10530 [Thiothrix sp.]|nr:hypothetical protein [Thiothrix sp.]HPE60167.1 DUF5691 domain-containing protein [Thiolinea sp.]
MSLQQDLLRIALLGTERQHPPLQGDAALQPYLAQLYPAGQVAAEAPEAAFLGVAALALQYQAAGRLPAQFSGVLPTPDNQPEPGPSLIPAAAEMHLGRLLADSQLRPLLAGWLIQVAKQHRQVPVSFIPVLMEQARQSRDLRPAISAVLGPRGYWLTTQHEDWRNLVILPLDTLKVADTADIEALVWEEGSPDQRCEYLQQIRSRSPAQALAQLQAVWKQEAAPVRLALLQALRTNLSPDDEPWLESCLDDRSKGVRQLAAELLGALPDSAFSQRMQTLLLGWLDVEVRPGLLSRLGGKKQLQVRLPETWDKTWLRDGIEEKPPRGQGAKAWWLEQALAFVPPWVWTQRWQLHPAELLVLVQDSDWKEALLGGLQAALLRYPDSTWAQLWLTREDSHHSLWQVLSPAEAEATALTLLQQNSTLKQLDVLVRLSHPWSRGFSLKVLALLAVRLTRKHQQVYMAHAACRHLGYYFHPDCVDDFTRQLQEPLQLEEHAFHRLLNDTLFILRFRADMLAALETVPPKDPS